MVVAHVTMSAILQRHSERKKHMSDVRGEGDPEIQMTGGDDAPNSQPREAEAPLAEATVPTADATAKAPVEAKAPEAETAKTPEAEPATESRDASSAQSQGEQPKAEAYGPQMPPKDAAAGPEMYGPQQTQQESDAGKAGPEMYGPQQPQQESDAGKAGPEMYGPHRPEQGADGGKTGPEADKQEASGKDAEDGPKEPDQKRDDMFKVYKDTLESADWAYKAKTGDEREIGHKSVMLAEKAYVSAGLYDKKDADKLWEEATGRPPKAELQQRVAEAQGVDPARGIGDLTANLNAIQKKQELSNVTHNKDARQKQIATWESALGDHQARQRDFRQKASEELLKPEQPDRNDEGGLGMFLRSIKSGYRAGKDIKMGAAHGKRLTEYSGIISDAEREYKDDLLKHASLVGEVSGFTQTQGDGLDATAGDVGKNTQRFAGARKIVDKVIGMASRKSAAPEASNEKAGPAMDAAAEVVNAGKRNFMRNAMGRGGQGQGQGLGM